VELEETMKLLRNRTITYFFILPVVVAALAGCYTAYGLKSRYTSSVVEYLYPDKKDVSEQPTIPVLSLPLKVGIAFVPESAPVPGRGFGSSNGRNALSEKARHDLMERIAAEFKSYPYVQSIEKIPSAYLVAKGGFTNLDQLRTMYGIDVIALLSYDQVQNTDEGFLTLTYWTIVGAYIVKAERNETNTMMDAAVYHIASRKMLFRAPGTSQVKESATLVNLSEGLRKDSLIGFERAADNLVVNLHEQLEQFKKKVQEAPAEYRIEQRPGYRGGGSSGALFALGLVCIVGIGLWRGRKRK
jgi:rhombotail lipoprotein